MRQMVVEIPEDIAERFSSQAPISEQSRVVADMIRRLVFKPTWPVRTDAEWETLNYFDDAADDAWLEEMA